MLQNTQKHLAVRLLELIIVIFAANWFATKLSWYYTMWWFDMPMHTLGGVFLGLLFVYILVRFGYTKRNLKLFLYGILFVFIIGVLWEIFEFNIETFITFNPQNILDTLSDLCFDLAGGTAILLYLQKYFTTESQTSVQDSKLSNTQV